LIEGTINCSKIPSRFFVGQPCPGSLPLGIAVVDLSIVVFGVVFPRVAQKHRLQVNKFLRSFKGTSVERCFKIQFKVLWAYL
jgi:hypothetical protein